MKTYSRALRDDLASRMMDNREGTSKVQAFVTPNGVVWDYELINRDGGAFWVIREPHHTDAQIEEAKRWIKADHDVVGGVQIAMLQSEESLAIMRSYPHEGLCPDCHRGIPLDVVDGQACINCGHVFGLPRSANSMVSNPKLVALLERVCAVRLEKIARGMSEGTNGYLAFASAFLTAADEYGVDLHAVEQAITFTSKDAPIVAQEAA